MASVCEQVQQPSPVWYDGIDVFRADDIGIQAFQRRKGAMWVLKLINLNTLGKNVKFFISEYENNGKQRISEESTTK